MIFCSTRSVAYRKWRFPCKRRCAISTLHRARITHANLFSRVAQPCELHLSVCHLETVILTSACHVSHLMTTETHDADWILSLVSTMNKHEVPSYYDSHASNTTKGLRSGSIIFGQDPTCQPATNLSELIAKQVLCRPDSHKNQEPNVIKMMVSPMQLTDPFAAPIQISLSVNPNQLKTERSESNLRLCGENWQISSKFSSSMEMTKVHLSSQRSTPAHKSSASRIEENGVGKPVFKLAPFGSGQTFTVVALELSVPGISLEVLQRVFSQANKANV